MSDPRLLAFITDERAKGASNDRIKEAAQKQGWSEGDVNGALAAVSLANDPLALGARDRIFSAPPVREHGGGAVWLLILILLLLGSAGIYSAFVHTKVNSGTTLPAATTTVPSQVVPPDTFSITPVSPADLSTLFYPAKPEPAGSGGSDAYAPAASTPAPAQSAPAAPASSTAPESLSATLSASTPSVNYGDTLTLTWSSTDATSCQGDGFNTQGATSGSLSIQPTNSNLYTIVCKDFTTGKSLSQSVTVNVSGSAPLISINPTTGVETTPSNSTQPSSPAAPGTPSAPSSPSGYDVYPGCASPATTYTRTVYIDPVNGSDSGDGSEANPWKTLATVLSKKLIEPGDHVVLLAGDQGTVSITKFDEPSLVGSTSWIWLDFQPGAYTNSFTLDNMSDWLITGATVTEPNAVNGVQIVTLGTDTNVVFANSTVYTAADSSGWSASQWLNDAGNGILARDGSCLAIDHNSVYNVFVGIAVVSDASSPPQNDMQSLVAYNDVGDHSGDGMHGVASDLTYEHNFVHDVEVSVAQGNGNHADCFQQWALAGGQINNNLVDSNWCQESTEPGNPYIASFQGLDDFDTYGVNNLRVTNNVVIGSDANGIVYGGATNTTIDHNTVVNPTTNGNNTWIYITPGATPSNNVISNNIAIKVRQDGDPEATYTNDYPTLGMSPTTLYTTFDRSTLTFDLTPLPGSSIYNVGAGSSYYTLSQFLADGGVGLLALNTGGSRTASLAVASPPPAKTSAVGSASAQSASASLPPSSLLASIGAAIVQLLEFIEKKLGI